MPLKIRTKTMLGTHHSWSVTMRNIFAQFIEQNHDCYINSVDGYGMVLKSWTPYVNRDCTNADIDLCYTVPKNFDQRFNPDSKCKMAIYNYETSHLPEYWKDKIKHVDYVLPSSKFSQQVFLDAGWPKDKCVVVPHGINIQDFEDKSTVKLHNQNKFRFLNISIPHYRKNIDLLVDAYYSAFTSDDDVCLILKTNLIAPDRPPYKFEANVVNQLKNVQKKYISMGRKNLPAIEILQDRLPSMVPLYNSCDCLVSASSSEGFGLPLLEGLASNLVVIAPRCTGQLDFLNDNNSLLVDTKVIEATEKYQYWKPTKGATTFAPIVEDLADKMRAAYKNKSRLLKSFESEKDKTIKQFTWTNAANKILELV